MVKTIQKEYVAYCATCGDKLLFEGRETPEELRGICQRCGNKWLFLFDNDPDGKFGVISFQCDNEDRNI